MKLYVVTCLSLLLSLSAATSSLTSEQSKDQSQPAGQQSTISNLFSMFNTNQNTNNNNRLENSQLEMARRIFKGSQVKYKKDHNSSEKDQEKAFLESLPLKMLLPKRKAPINIDMMDAPMNPQKQQSRQKRLPFFLLNKFLNDFRKKQVKPQLEWENPHFKDQKTGESKPLFQIMGKENRGRTSKSADINEDQIESMLKQKIPFLRQGKVVGMSASRFKKGLLLKIEYLNFDSDTAEEKLYAITARYKPRKSKLEIISIKEQTQSFSKEQAQQQAEDIQVDETPEEDNPIDFNDQKEAENTKDQTDNLPTTSDTNNPPNTQTELQNKKPQEKNFDTTDQQKKNEEITDIKQTSSEKAEPLPQQDQQLTMTEKQKQKQVLTNLLKKVQSVRHKEIMEEEVPKRDQPQQVKKAGQAGPAEEGKAQVIRDSKAQKAEIDKKQKEQSLPNKKHQQDKVIEQKEPAVQEQKKEQRKESTQPKISSQKKQEKGQQKLEHKQPAQEQHKQPAQEQHKQPAQEPRPSTPQPQKTPTKVKETKEQIQDSALIQESHKTATNEPLSEHQQKQSHKKSSKQVQEQLDKQEQPVKDSEVPIVQDNIPSKMLIPKRKEPLRSSSVRDEEVPRGQEKGKQLDLQQSSERASREPIEKRKAKKVSEKQVRETVSPKTQKSQVQLADDPGTSK